MSTTSIDFIHTALVDAEQGLRKLQQDKATLSKISDAADVLIESFKNQGSVYSCGNGGSLCDAMHFAEELSGRFRHNRAALPAIAFGDAAHMSCVANDFGYEHVFLRFVQAFARPGDVLLAISTSGSRKNVLLAAEEAQNRGMKVIALTGKYESLLEDTSDICIVTPAGSYSDRVQELHIKVIHILVELVERGLFPENYENR